MEAMATQPRFSALTAYGHANDYDRLTHSGPVMILRDCDKASPARQGLKHEENSLPESRWSRSEYLRVRKTPRSGNRYVARVSARPVAGGRIEAQPRVEQPKPHLLLPLQVSLEQTRRKLEHIKAALAHVRHLQFLKQASTGADAAITAETARIAAKAWRQIWVASGRKLPVPAAVTNADGKVFYSWDNDRYHLDLDIVPNEPASIFFCDRKKNEYWCEDYQIGFPLPNAVIATLKFFA
jgi:hypothetical protein